MICLWEGQSKLVGWDKPLGLLLLIRGLPHIVMLSSILFKAPTIIWIHSQTNITRLVMTNMKPMSFPQPSIPSQWVNSYYGLPTREHFPNVLVFIVNSVYSLNNRGKQHAVWHSVFGCVPARGVYCFFQLVENQIKECLWLVSFPRHQDSLGMTTIISSTLNIPSATNDGTIYWRLWSRKQCKLLPLLHDSLIGSWL